MKSTGEVMGIDSSFGMAFAKSQLAAGFRLPLEGRVFISVHDLHKEGIVPIARTFQEMGFQLAGTRGTAAYLHDHGVHVWPVLKVSEDAQRPGPLKERRYPADDKNQVGGRSSTDATAIRRGALLYDNPYSTTLAGTGHQRGLPGAS
jgi:carbamoyl-phosphate synthase large subunit